MTEFWNLLYNFKVYVFLIAEYTVTNKLIMAFDALTIIFCTHLLHRSLVATEKLFVKKLGHVSIRINIICCIVTVHFEHFSVQVRTVTKVT